MAAFPKVDQFYTDYIAQHQARGQVWKDAHSECGWCKQHGQQSVNITILTPGIVGRDGLMGGTVDLCDSKEPFCSSCGQVYSFPTPTLAKPIKQTAPANSLAAMANMYNYTSPRAPLIEKVQMTSKVERHKCKCDMRVLMSTGCKCGGI